MAEGAQPVIGVDFGTLSARALVVDAADGQELGAGEFEYPHSVMDRELAQTGERLPPEWALQDPSDYLEALRHAIPDALEQAGVDRASVAGVATDFTACTILPANAEGEPLCRLEEFRERPHAYVKLWKHHAAQPQADRVTELAAERQEPWLGRYGGRISSEWAFAKALQVLEEDEEVYRRMDHWLEAADWIVWQLGGRLVRNVCTAGYKELRQDGSFPSEEYCRALDERFQGFTREKLSGPLGELGSRAGELTAQAAGWTGLPEGIPVAVGNVDAHVTAPAAQAIRPGEMTLIMGTSTCHVMTAERPVEVEGMCGVVQGGIVPGLWGYEAGQSAVGDIFAWFVDRAVPPHYHEEARRRGRDLHAHLSELAAEQRVGEHGLVALDWWNGNRSILVDHNLTGVLAGATLATRPEDVYRALIEATAFGTRVIVEAFERQGIAVESLVAAGGLLSNPFLMQVYSDVLNRPIDVLDSAQGPALGAAMHAAVAAGIHEDIQAASEAMGRRRPGAYEPDRERAAAYDRLYRVYLALHDWFGRENRELMRELQRIRDERS